MMDAAEHIIQSCIEGWRQKVLIIYDNTTECLVDLFQRALEVHKKKCKLIKIDLSGRHGAEPSDDVLQEMLRNEQILCITKYSLAHTKARQIAALHGIPFLSMPDYNISTMHNEAMFADYSDFLPQMKRYTELLTKGKTVEIRSQTGTQIRLNIDGRKANCCPGLTNSDFLLGSPPDAEVNISPNELLSNGIIVVDGSITDQEIGVLSDKVTLFIENGKIAHIDCIDRVLKKKVEDVFLKVPSDKARIVGELGIGFNDKARLCGNMLVDEGALGGLHFGMGSNWTIGGRNEVDFHLDFVIRAATMEIDDEIVIEEGKLLYA